MKALSLHQPWASWVAQAKKPIETRWWYTSYRGNLLICATKKPKHDWYPSGVALCVVDLFDCRRMLEADEEAACCAWYDGFSWLLRNLRVLKDPIPVSGAQRIWNSPLELSDLVFVKEPC